tara:strand:+ start:16571 stop:24721 length:8151 start_codon:yes stop_codon:yes gene_type:complete
MPWNPDTKNVITLPNGEQVEIPSGVSLEQARLGVLQQYPELFPDYEAPSGFFPAIHSSWENIKGSFGGAPEIIAAGTPLGGSEEQRQKLLEGAQRTYEEYATASLEALPDAASRGSIAEAYEEGGLWGALPETGRFAREALGQQVPIMGGAALAQRLGGSQMVAKSALGKAGTSMLSRLLPAATSRLLPAAFATPWTGALAATALFATFAFSDMLRDQAENAEEVEDIDPLRAAAYAAPHAAMEYLGFALTGAFGPLKQRLSGTVLKDSLSGLSSATGRTALRAAGRQAVDSASEFPTELAQTILERAQANESVSFDDAGFVNSLLDTAAATVPVVGVLGSYGSYRAYKNENLKNERFKKLTENEQTRRESNRVAREEALDKDEKQAADLQRRNVERWNASRSNRESLLGRAEASAESEAKFEPVTFADVVDVFDSRGVDSRSKGAKAFMLRHTEGRVKGINQLKDLQSLPAAEREQRARDRRQVRSIMSGMKAYEYARTPGDLSLNVFTQEQFDAVIKGTRRSGKKGINGDLIRKILNEQAENSGYNFGNSQTEQDIAYELMKRLRDSGYATGSNLKEGLSPRRPGFTEVQYQEILRKAREAGRITQEMYELETNNFGRDKFDAFIDDVRVRRDLPAKDARAGVYVPSLNSRGVGENEVSIEQRDGYFIKDNEGNIVGGATTMPEAKVVRKYLRDVARSYSVTRDGEIVKTYKNRNDAKGVMEEEQSLDTNPNASWEIVSNPVPEMKIDKKKTLGWRVVERYEDEDGNVKDVYEDSFVPDEISARERLETRKNEYRYGQSDWDIKAERRKQSKFDEFGKRLVGLGAITEGPVALKDFLDKSSVGVSESAITWPENFELLKKIESSLETSGIGDDVTVRLIDSLGEGKIAAYESTRRIVFVSLSEMQKAQTAAELETLLDESINHETIHALKDLDLFTENEWTAMANTTARVKITDEMVARDPDNLNAGMSFLDHAAAVYGRGRDIDQILKDNYTRELIIEEAIANLYGTYRSSPAIAEQVKGNAKTLFDRIKIFFERLYNALSGTGYGDAGHVFMALTSEATAPIAKRERGKIRSIPPLRETDKTAYENIQKQDRKRFIDFKDDREPEAEARPRRKAARKKAARRKPQDSPEVEEELEAEIEILDGFNTPDETARYIATKAYPIKDVDKINKLGQRLAGNDDVQRQGFASVFDFKDDLGETHQGVLEASLDSNFADEMLKQNRPGFYYSFSVDGDFGELGYSGGGKKAVFRVLATSMEFMEKLADSFGAEVIRFTAEGEGKRTEYFYDQMANFPEHVIDDEAGSSRERVYRRAAIAFALQRGWNIYQRIEIGLQEPDVWREDEFTDPELKDSLKYRSGSTFVLSKINDKAPVNPKYDFDKGEFLHQSLPSTERLHKDVGVPVLAKRVEDLLGVMQFEIDPDVGAINLLLLEIKDELAYRERNSQQQEIIKRIDEIFSDYPELRFSSSKDMESQVASNPEIVSLEEPSIVTEVVVNVDNSGPVLGSRYILPLKDAGKQKAWPANTRWKKLDLGGLENFTESVNEERANVKEFREVLARQLGILEEGPDDTAKFMDTLPRAAGGSRLASQEEIDGIEDALSWTGPNALGRNATPQELALELERRGIDGSSERVFEEIGADLGGVSHVAEALIPNIARGFSKSPKEGDRALNDLMERLSLSQGQAAEDGLNPAGYQNVFSSPSHPDAVRFKSELRKRVLSRLDEEGLVGAPTPRAELEGFIPRIYDGPAQDLDVRPNIDNRDELRERAKAIASGEIEGLKYMATAVLPPERVVGSREYERIRNRDSPVKADRSWFDQMSDVLYGEDGKMRPSRLFQYFRQKYIDKYAAIARLSRKANERRLLHGEDPKLLASVNAAAAAYLSDKASGVIAKALTSGQPVYVGGITRIDFEKKGLFEILKDVYSAGLINDWHVWMLSKRDMRFDEKEGKVTRTSREDRAVVEEHLNKNPKLREMFERTNVEYQKWNENLVNYMVDTGVVSQELGEVFKQFGDYVPFFRDFEGTATERHAKQMSNIIGEGLNELRHQGVIPAAALGRDRVIPSSMFQSLTGVKASKRATGGKGLIVDPLEGIMRNLQAAITSGMKNVAGQRSMRDALLMEMAERVDTEADSNHSIRVNGEDLYFDVKDPLLHDALTGMTEGKIPMLSFFSGPSWLLREMVTRSPDFIVANLLRDSISTWATSGSSMTPFVGTIQNFFSGGVSLEDPSGPLKELIGAGVAGGGYDNARVTDDVYKIFNRRMRKEGLTLGKDTGFGDKFVSSTLGKIWDWTGDVTTKSDAATRMAVYQDVMTRLTGQGVSRVEAESEAIYQAMEVINFSRRGNSMIARVVGAAIPFLNARVQGLDVLWRTGKGHYSSDYTKLSSKQSIIKFLARGSTIATMTGLYALMVHDDDEWKSATAEEQDDYWILPGMGEGLAVKIPIPFEIGVIFKVLPERFMRHFMSGTEVAGVEISEAGYADRRQTIKALKRAFISTFEINPFGIQATKPILEAYTNHSFFTGRPIIPVYMEKRFPREQYREGTNAMAVAIGEAFNASPLDIEHVLRGYTGTVGSWIMMAMDEALRTYGTMPSRASFRADQYPLFRRFLQSDLGSQGPVNDFYSLRQDVETIMDTIRDISKTPGRMDESIELQKKYKGVSEIKPLIESMDRQMASLRRYQRGLMESNKSQEEKRVELDRLDARKKDILSRLPELRKRANLPYSIR